MNSIDRKLARCQHEIEAAKPKGLSLDDFRFLKHSIYSPARGKLQVVEEADCRQIKRAAPESKPVYRCETCCDTFRVMTMVCYGGRPFEKEDDCPDCSTLEAQLKPKAEDGWIEWKGGECPIPHAKPGEYELRFSDGDEVESTISVEWWELLWSKETAPETYWIVAYRVVKP